MNHDDDAEEEHGNQNRPALPQTVETVEINDRYIEQSFLVLTYGNV
jgi:hypothetical protein